MLSLSSSPIRAAAGSIIPRLGGPWTIVLFFAGPGEAYFYLADRIAEGGQSSLIPA
jgi:hypothetical protein